MNKGLDLDRVLETNEDRQLVKLPLTGNTNEVILNMSKAHAIMDEYVHTLQDHKDVPENMLRVRVTDGKIALAGKQKDLPLRRWAFSQLATRAGVPTSFMHKLIRMDRMDMVVGIINEMIKTNDHDKKTLIRTSNGQVRGILSDKYAALDNHTLLDMVEYSLKATGKYYTLQSMVLNEEIMNLRIIENSMLPIDGEDLFAGFVIKNSDVGKSSLVIELMVFKAVCSNGLILGGGKGTVFRRRHVGIKADDLADQVASIVAELPQYMDYVQSVVQATKGVKITSPMLQSLIDQCAKDLEIKERKLVQGALDDYLPNYEMTLWGYANALTEWAQEFSADRQEEIERYAGRVLESAL